MRRRPRIWIFGAFTTAIFIITATMILLFRVGSRSAASVQAGGSISLLARSTLYDQPSDGYLDQWFPSVRGVILVLCRNRELDAIVKSVRSLEGRWNHRYNYPYVFLNDDAFTPEFKKAISSVVRRVQFGQVPSDMWSYPVWIDQRRAKQTRHDMSSVAYGSSESYRFMCRFFSGLVQHHPLLASYEFYWRLEPGVKFTCDIKYDVFRFMRRHGKKYGFVLAMEEIPETIETLYETILQHYGVDRIPSRHPFVRGNFYSGCHYWNNFEVVSLDWLRSRPYQDYFDVLDQAGGFFYERWGDAPVRTLGAALTLNAAEVHYFGDIGYVHGGYGHCPLDFVHRKLANCTCDPLYATGAEHACLNSYHLERQHHGEERCLGGFDGPLDWVWT